MEKYYGAFLRSFQLSANVKADKIGATFEKRGLKITLPKTKEAMKKQIEIKAKEEEVLHVWKTNQSV